MSRQDKPLTVDGSRAALKATLDERTRELDEARAREAAMAEVLRLSVIENTRLLNELRQRTDDLTESREYQTAIGEILGVISKSPTQVQPVFDIIAASALRLCNSTWSAVVQFDGDLITLASFHNIVDVQGSDALRGSFPRKPSQSGATDRAVSTRTACYFPDVTELPDYDYAKMVQALRYRSVLSVPMLRDGQSVGAITVVGLVRDAFSERQMGLLRTFADQAVIAIENVRLFNEIQDKGRQLEEASKHKSQFLANMSHELRTPLNAVLGYTELIVDGIYGDTPQKVQDALKRITINGKHLLGLINDVLDLSKIEAGHLTLSLADYSMKDVVHAVYGAVEPLAAEKKLGFKVDIAPDLPTGHGDEGRLMQVLLNLVGNAIKFTDSGMVAIKAARADGMFSVAVSDTGPGISEDDQKKLFQEFQQADSSSTKKKGGTGLGLAISKKIIEMHGGRVWLESQVGQGSTFTFTMPLRAEQPERQA